MATVFTFGSSTSLNSFFGDYYNYNPPVYDDWYSTDKAFAQGFSFVDDYTIDSATFYMRRWGDGAPPTTSIPGYARVSIHSAAPDGAEIASATVDRLTISTTPGNVTFTFTSPPVCYADTQYYCVIEDPESLRDNRPSENIRDQVYIYFPYSGTELVLCYDAGPYSPKDWVTAGIATLNGSLQGSLNEEDPPSKATNPSPANGATTDGCYDRLLSWNADEDADGHNVYIGASAGNLSLLGATSDDSYVVPEVSFPKETIVYWRVDSYNDEGTTTGDEWNFDPRPKKVDNPTPNDSTSGLTLNQSRLYWDAGDLNQSWDVYFGPSGDLSLVGTGITDEYWDTSDLGVYSYIPFAYGTTYQWRIDSVNVNGTTTGDTWSFTTVVWAPPAPSTWPLKAAGGGEVGSGGTFIDGANFVASNRRLIAACGSSIWYESYDEED